MSSPRLAGNPYVILGESEEGHLVNLQKPWLRIKTKAGLENVRMHDLRHTYASVAVMGGIDLFLLKEIMGHKNLQTTLRYSHFAYEAVQQATGSVASRLAGGFLAQSIAYMNGNSPEVIAYNSPGLGGLVSSVFNWQGLLEPNFDNYTYVYSNPSTWNTLDVAIHGAGMQMSDNVFYVVDAVGHGISELAGTLTPNTQLIPEVSVPIVGGTLNFYDIVATIGDPGDVNGDGRDDLTVYLNSDGTYTVIRTFLNDAFNVNDPSIRGQDIYSYTLSAGGEIIDREHFRFNPNQRFPAGTPIQLWNRTTKPIETITQSDIVLTHDAEGKAVPGIVDKLFSNTTAEFVRLAFDDGREDLVATPGHRFLTETGDYMEIGHMLRLGGGTVRLTDTDGSIIEATGEVIAYSAETAEMFGEVAAKMIAFAGKAVINKGGEHCLEVYGLCSRSAA